jgi:tetratricopeptide (TPR) repeat protein
MINLMTIRTRRIIFWLVAAGAVVLVAATLRLARERRANGPSTAVLDQAIRMALADPRALAERIGEVGPEAGADVYGSLRNELATADDGTRRALVADMARLAAVLSQRYLLPEYQDDVEYWQAKSPAGTRALARRLIHLDTVFRDDTRDAAAVRDTLAADLEEFRAADYPFGVVLAESYLATNALMRGESDEARHWSGRYLADARRWNLQLSTADALCVAAMHGVVTSEAAVAQNLEEALAIARASRLAGLAGRVHAIAGIQAHEEGRFAQEGDHFEEAVLVCRELGQAARGLPYMVLLMQFYAAFDDWNQVEALAPRADALAAEARSLADAGLWRDEDRLECDLLRLDELRARTLLARGRIDEAQTLYPRLLSATRRLPFQDTAYVHDRRCGGLLAAGEPVLALVAAREALDYAATVPLEEWAVRFRLHEARALLACADTAAAAVSLAVFDSAAVGRHAWVDDLQPAACVVRAGLAGARSDRAATVLAAGLAEMVRGLAAGDASARAYLDLARADGLRLALHDAVVRDARTGYGLELLWRRLPVWLGDPQAAPPRDGAQLVALARELAHTAEARLRAEGASHCLYARRGARVVRWTASSRGVVCDTLSVRGGMLATQIAGVLALLAEDPGDSTVGTSPELAARLRDLAEDLLPDDLLPDDTLAAASVPATFYVSAAGDLALLPFAALNVGTPPRYDPLVTRCDVVTVRAGGDRPAAARAVASLVVAAPEITPRLRRLYPGLGDLVGGAREAEQVRAWLPSAELLLGAQATRDAVTARWEEADCLYFAGHAVRSPEAPYRTFLPLSAGSGGGLAGDAGQLDINDIRSADLHRVRLVVLSGCASGAPYVSGEATAPSLGDAFLDAGAAAAVQTLWRVRDDASPQLLADFLRAWRHDDVPLTVAFGRAQREFLRGNDGVVRHPFGWAAYTVNLRALE